MRASRPPQRLGRLAPAVLVSVFAGFWQHPAQAQGISGPPASPALSPPLGDVSSELPERSAMAPGSVAIFDYEHTWGGLEFEGGPMWWRKGATNLTGNGWELSFAAVSESRVGQLFLAGLVRMQFRYFDASSIALSPLQNMAMAGLRLGPFEPESRVGFSLLTFDVFHGAYSFEMFSPRVEGGFGLRFGRLRISAHGFSEMLWRWWGSNYFDKGVAFELRLEARKKKSPLDP